MDIIGNHYFAHHNATNIFLEYPSLAIVKIFFFFVIYFQQLNIIHLGVVFFVFIQFDIYSASQ